MHIVVGWHSEIILYYINVYKSILCELMLSFDKTSEHRPVPAKAVTVSCCGTLGVIKKIKI
jgi:hypothetical protein